MLAAVAQDVDLTAIADEQRLTADLARLAPDVFGGQEGAFGCGGPDEDRFRSFDAVARVLRRVTHDHALVVVLDDAHWADPSSLLLLQHLASSMVIGQRLLVVVNYRDTGPVTSVLVTGLPAERATREIEIKGLAAGEVGAQPASLVGSERAGREAGRVHARTGGNQFFVVSSAGRLWTRALRLLTCP